MMPVDARNKTNGRYVYKLDEELKQFEEKKMRSPWLE